jgi:RNA polymerase sigma factor (sigma-70 family)
MDSRPLYNLLQRLRRSADPSGGGLSDAELLLRFVRQRDEAAFELLVWRHGPMVLGVCRRVLCDAYEAEDAFQATFLALVRKADSIARGGAVAPWLYRVAFRIALRARATAAQRQARSGLPSDLAAPEADSPVERDWQPILDEEIDRLPERYRLPVVLCHLQGYTLAQAAQQLGCPRGTVAVRLVRARQRLRARLTHRGVMLGGALAFALATRRAVSAALVKITVRATLGYTLGGAATTLSTSVLTLTEGVLRAMFVRKLKFVAAVLLATMLGGVGAGWAAYQAAAGEAPGAGPVALAVPPANVPPVPKNAPAPLVADEKAAEEHRREEQQERLALAEKRLRLSEKEIEAQEEQWLEELIEARLKVMNLQQEISTRERELAGGPATENSLADPALRNLMSDRDKLAQMLEQLRRLQAKGDDPATDRLTKEIAATEDNMRKREQELNKDVAEKKKVQERALADLRGLRRDFLVAEEKLRALRRRQEWKREEARRDLEDRAQHVRQCRQSLEDAGSGPPPKAQQPVELEKKLDQVLRELAELRRTLRRPEENKQEEP